MSSLVQLAENKILKDPKLEIFSLVYKEKKVWVKKARGTGSHLFHKLAYLLTQNTIVIPVENKSPQEAVKFESTKLQRLSALSIPVPKVLETEETYFIIEDCGPTIRYLLKNNLVSDPTKLFEKIISALALMHNANEYHGASQIKNITYKEDKIYFIDFEESFNQEIDIDDLQFRDLFLFLFSLSRLNMEIDFESIILKYIALTGNKDVIQKFHTLISKVSFLIKLIENKMIWKYLDRDTKSVYLLLQKLKNISPNTGYTE